MRIYFIIPVFFIAISLSVTVHAQEAFNRQRANNFFQDIQTGKVVNIASMLTDPLKSRLKRLLQDNKEYSKMLEKKFFKSRFAIDQILEVPNGDKIANVTVYYRNGDTSTHRFLMKFEDNIWKFADEIFNHSSVQ